MGKASIFHQTRTLAGCSMRTQAGAQIIELLSSLEAVSPWHKTFSKKRVLALSQQLLTRSENSSGQLATMCRADLSRGIN